MKQEVGDALMNRRKEAQGQVASAPVNRVGSPGNGHQPGYELPVPAHIADDIGDSITREAPFDTIKRRTEKPNGSPAGIVPRRVQR
ncbi:MAG: hypothetical protein V3U63_00230 [Gemmatimonadota bacterium]